MVGNGEKYSIKNGGVNQMGIGKIIAWGIVISSLLVVVFVRPKELGGASGGEQASQIINSTTKGFASVIAAAQGRNV